jgi:beta-lactam-binding protein with PASTA domain
VREVRLSLTEAELDALPPQALTAKHDNAEDRTSVIPRALTVPRPLPVNGDDRDGEDDEDGINRTARLATPPVPPRRRRPRAVLAVIAAVLVVFGVGAGIWYINSGQFTRVPPLLARTEAQARERLSTTGLNVEKVEHAYSDTVRRGTVIGSDPASGARIRVHGSVALTVSLGPETVNVPDVANLPLAQAQARLRADALEPGVVTRAFSDGVPRGSVIGTTPSAGTRRHAGSVIALVVSKGSPIEVPDVTGDDLAGAQEELTDAGLKVRVAEKPINSAHDPGEVAAQSPGGGRQVAEGDTVTLTLSKGPEMVQVPDVVGDSVADAHQALESAGFKVSEDRGLLGLFGNTVKRQSIKGGDEAPKGSTIRITIR